MPTTYTNGLKLPDLGSIDWYNSYKNNIDILDPIVGTVNGVATTYAPISHNHSASEITSGTIDIARLPPAALERMHIVADQTARYALTTSTVQEGDTVKQTDTKVMYLVVDSTKLNSADGYTEYSAGTASKAIADEDGTSIKTGYVSVAGNQTVTGQKVWTQAQVFQNNVYLANTSYTVGTIPTSNITSTCFFSGASNYQIGYCRSVVYKTTGQTSAELTARNKFTNGALDPNGDYTNATFTVNLDADGTRWIQFANSSIKNGLTPYTTDTYNIGSATNQWLRMFAKFYYYNGVAWGLDQNNTWTGINTFSSVTVKDTSALSNGDYGGALAFRDNQGNRHAYIQPYKNTSGVVNLVMGVDNSGSVQLNSSLIPYATNAISLGSSSYQWSSVYAQSYYYNGTEFQSKFVTTNTEQSIASLKTITTAGSPQLRVKSTSLDLTNTAVTSYRTISIRAIDKNDTTLGQISWNYKASDNTGRLNLVQTSRDAVVGGIIIQHNGSNSTTDIIPYDTTNAHNLGTSTNKWKSFNGINPGALSLPDIAQYVDLTASIPSASLDGNTGIDLSSYITSNGWLSIVVPDTNADDFIFVQTGTNLSNRFFMSGAKGNGFISLMMPINRFGGVNAQIKASSVSFCRFYPCLGNV